jgi:hemerythrin-like domain-containing protein
MQYRNGEIAMENRVETNKTECIHATHQSKAVCGCSHHHFDKATEMLSDEHRVIERVLAVLQKLTTRPVENSLDCWRKALDFFSRFADQCHHLKEEKILFPAMEEHGIPRDGGPIGMMLIEHEEGRGYVRTMTAALTLAEATDEAAKDSLLNNARAYLRLLREHIQKEDEILFRIADDVIPADEQKALLRSFEEHEAKEMGTGVHEKYLKLVEELERHCP